jgi:hypothetical protein
MEMTRRGKRGEPQDGFPRFPRLLGITEAAIPTFPQARRRGLFQPKAPARLQQRKKSLAQFVGIRV